MHSSLDELRQLIDRFLLEAKAFFGQPQLGLLVDHTIEGPDNPQGKQGFLVDNFPVRAR